MIQVKGDKASTSPKSGRVHLMLKNGSGTTFSNNMCWSIGSGRSPRNSPARRDAAATVLSLNKLTDSVFSSAIAAPFSEVDVKLVLAG